MENLLPLLGLVIVGVVTPGPNNFMVLASGANWGLARTMPHIAGISIGFPVMVLGVGLGFDAVFDAVPELRDILKIVAFVFVLWLAWRIARAGRPEEVGSRARPLNFLEAAVFQWVNPKAWAIVFAAVALFTDDSDNQLVEIGVTAAAFGFVCVPNGIVWTLFGSTISRALADDIWRRRFNVAMAVLLVVSVLPTLV
jgi:threonine/homoserine/homoserine lactone efflux protein